MRRLLSTVPLVLLTRRATLFVCCRPTGAPPLWLKSPSLPRTFVLELLDFVLANSPDVFRRLPPFQNALAVRMTQLIQAQLQVRGWQPVVRG